MFRRGDCVYIEIISNASRVTLQAIIGGKVDHNSVSYTDSGLSLSLAMTAWFDLDLDKYLWINYGNNVFVKGSRHVNDI